MMPGVFQNSYQKREAKITKYFWSGILNLLFDVFTYNTRDILLIASNSQNIRAYDYSGKADLS